MDWTQAVQGLMGGILIGLSGAALLLLSGKVAGISGILSGALKPVAGEWAWRLWFIGGLAAGGLLLFLLAPSKFAVELNRDWPLLAVGGLLVGFGARLGSGCTSGHGVCGISRFSPRSWTATGVFITTGVITVYVLEHML